MWMLDRCPNNARAQSRCLEIPASALFSYTVLVCISIFRLFAPFPRLFKFESKRTI
ncbi:hypothetical protein BT69DRAFT_1278899 [Atractiella rhizophila]|nr:hypothetical protein BT69DRAFT_1278899 [Atractiella rhizophila]